MACGFQACSVPPFWVSERREGTGEEGRAARKCQRGNLGLWGDGEGGGAVAVVKESWVDTRHSEGQRMGQTQELVTWEKSRALLLPLEVMKN